MTSDPALPILVVTGLGREARLVSGPRITTIWSGASPARLRIALDQLAPAYRAVVSFGIAGGLSPTLAPGDVIVASDIVARSERWAAHPGIVRDWAHCLSASGQRVILAKIAGAEAPLLTPADKTALYCATGAVGVDMESHIAAAFAAAHAIPFAAIRVICDPAGRSLPPFVAEVLRPDENINLLGFLREAMRQPLQLTALPRLARDASAAFASLGRCRALLGPSLGLTSISESFGDVPRE
ncbi:phosphorylase [Microvirga sp. 2TAF3]|uniref:phosphorylase n=1 Tax=Microvirga sp. 2TAF3 TaxID=3233014 RepID=UPI003F9641BF